MWRPSGNAYFVLILVLALVICNMPKIVAQSAPVLPANPNMFEISTRPWLYLLSQKYGRNISTLSDIPDPELQAFADRGFNMIWFMGVWSLGQYGLNYDRTNPGLQKIYSDVLPGYTTDDVIGSPYAVTEYTCNPELGSDSDIASLRSRLHSMGMQLMLDFVPNHSAVDAPLVSSNPEYYVHAPKGQDPPYDNNTYYVNGLAYGGMGWGLPWYDTLQFNYWNPDLVKLRIQELLKVASLSDAIRCDMAYLLLNDQIGNNWGKQLSSWGYTRPSDEFWSVAIKAVKQQYPNTVFLAEVYDPYQQTLLSQGFDFVYDKDLYDRLGSGNLDNVRGFINGVGAGFLQHGANFVQNHDEPPAAAFFGSWWRADAAALLTMTLPGMRFYFMGQFEGFKNRLQIQLRRALPEPVVPEVEALYQRLTNITSDVVFHKGTWTYIPLSGEGTSWQLCAWRWAYGNDKRLCVINFSASEASANVTVADAEPVSGQDLIPVTDLLEDQVYMRSAAQMRSQGLSVVVNQWWAQIFKY
eukprot:TRINITY_DN8342_c0_g1_i1.p1 TRINITY_DN8342_c0_g1~~TRINITY_DN8342_c0_g1_i1.p1  ORF type:complete len:524 (-),score=84.56 TRINITY_DN8342_c0_g1_i1:420-1991(-)